MYTLKLETQPSALVKNVDSGATLPGTDTQLCSRSFFTFVSEQEAETRVRWLRQSPLVQIESGTKNLTDQGDYFNAIFLKTKRNAEKSTMNKNITLLKIGPSLPLHGPALIPRPTANKTSFTKTKQLTCGP